MTFTTFSSHWVVYKAVLKRLKWFGILYGVALFLQLPLLLWMEFARRQAMQGDIAAQLTNNSFYTQILFNPILHLVNIIVPIVFGLIIFYYLQQDRASTFFHSLPIKRGVMYLQNLLAGLTLLWTPLLINGILVYGVFSVFGVTKVQMAGNQVYSQVGGMINNGPELVSVGQVMALWLFISLVMTALFFIFTEFIGMLTGNVLLQGGLTFVGLFLPLGVLLLVRFNLWKLLYGFPRNINDRVSEWLSPVVSYLNNQNYRFESITWYMWYLGAAIIFCLAGLYLYRFRNAEAAGETLAADWIRWIFKYGAAICAALTGGAYFSSFNEYSTGTLYMGHFIGAVLGYIVADMIAYKSFHFYRRWKGMLIFGAVFILLLSSVNLDIFGYEKYIPEKGEVKEVILSTLNRDGTPTIEGLKEPENIERVRQLHQQMIKLEQENKSLEKLSRYKENETNVAGPMNVVVSVDITYVLKGGSEVKRTYGIDMSKYREYLYPIFESDEAKRLMYSRLFKMDVSKIDQINVNNNHIGKNIRIYKREEIDQAVEALREDVLTASYEAVVEGKVPVQASVDFVTKPDSQDQAKMYGYYNLNYFTEFKNFEAFLKERGYLKELVLDPQEVSKIIVKKAGTNETVEVTDKDKIMELVNWGNLEDERSYLMRQQQPVQTKQNLEYYGKIEKVKGSPVYIMFDPSPYARQLVEDILKNK